MEFITHTLAPVFDQNSKVLILGTMPSPKSRELRFYYGHPQNRFWKVLSLVLGAKLPHTNEDKQALCLSHRIALWDVLASCYIKGAQDSSIRDPIPNDFSSLIKAAPIQAVFTTGATAHRFYRTYCEAQYDLPVHPLPSTSAANCQYSVEHLASLYEAILPYLA